MALNFKLRVSLKPPPTLTKDTPVSNSQVTSSDRKESFSPELRRHLTLKVEEALLSRMLEAFPVVYYDDQNRQVIEKTQSCGNDELEVQKYVHQSTSHIKEFKQELEDLSEPAVQKSEIKNAFMRLNPTL